MIFGVIIADNYLIFCKLERLYNVIKGRLTIGPTTSIRRDHIGSMPQSTKGETVGFLNYNFFMANTQCNPVASVIFFNFKGKSFGLWVNRAKVWFQKRKLVALTSASTFHCCRIYYSHVRVFALAKQVTLWRTPNISFLDFLFYIAQLLGHKFFGFNQFLFDWITNFLAHDMKSVFDWIGAEFFGLDFNSF